jgi:Glycosyltransferase family 87
MNIESQYLWLFENLRKAIRKPLFGVSVVTVSVCAIIAFGILGIGRHGEAYGDVRYWYLSAKAWLAGLNPYDYSTFQTLAKNNGLGKIEVFAYPPQSFALGILLAVFPFTTAQVVWNVLNVIALIVLVFWGVQLLRTREVHIGVEPSRLARWFIPAIIVGNPFTAHVIWTGQISLIIASTILTGWQLSYRGNFLLAGVLLGFSTIKPQLSLLIFLWLILEGHWRTLLMSSASILAFSTIPTLVVGPSKILADWMNSMKAYQLEPSKAIGLSYNTNLKSLFNGLGIELPLSSLLFFMLAAIAITLIFWRLWRCSQLDESDILGMLLGLSLLLFFGRDYDMVVLVPLLPAMWWHVRNHPRSQLASFGVMAALFIPHRLVEKIQVPYLLYWRILILMVLVLWLFCSSFNEQRKIKLQLRQS